MLKARCSILDAQRSMLDAQLYSIEKTALSLVEKTPINRI
jgi:hypothetical protein